MQLIKQIEWIKRCMHILKRKHLCNGYTMKQKVTNKTPKIYFPVLLAYTTHCTISIKHDSIIPLPNYAS